MGWTLTSAHDEFIRTILGDIPPAALGPTSSHDHLIRVGGGEVLADGEDMDLSSVDKAIEEARYFLQAGGRAIIDMCPIDMGRNIERLVAVNAALPDLRIVVATGFHKGSLYAECTAHWINRYTVRQIADLIIADIEEGVDLHDYSGPIVNRSDARAGVIKVATGYGRMTPFEEVCVHAAAIASIETGCPINTHTQHGTLALEQAEVLIGYGVRPEKITLGHVQRNPDLWYHKKICALGCNVMYDGGYRVKYLPDSTRVELIRGLVKAGYGDRITLGTDSGRRSYQRAYGAATGIDYDLAVFKPRLLEEGMDPEVVDAFFVANPARAFSFGT